MTKKEQEAVALWNVMARVYEAHEARNSVHPTWLATEAMNVIGFPRTLHSLGYVGCHLAFRQIAREYCRQRFDPVRGGDAADDKMADLFSGLQDRYPIPPLPGEDPTYVRLALLTQEQVLYNAERMRRAASGLMKHADALLAYGKEKFGPEAA